MNTQIQADRQFFGSAKADTRHYQQIYGKNRGTPGDDVITEALDAIPECEVSQHEMKLLEFPLRIPPWEWREERSQGQGPRPGNFKEALDRAKHARLRTALR